MRAGAAPQLALGGMTERRRTKGDKPALIKHLSAGEDHVIKRSLSHACLSVIESSVHATRPLVAGKPQQYEHRIVVKRAYDPTRVCTVQIARLKERPAYTRRERTVKIKADVADAPVASHRFSFCSVHRVYTRKARR